MVLVRGGGTQSSTTIFQLFFSPFGWLLEGFGLLLQLFSLLLNLAWQLITNLHWVILFALLISINAFWLPHHSTLLESTEVIWRCNIIPIYESVIRDLWLVFVEGYESIICWTNAAGFINRLFSVTSILSILRTCPDSANVNINITFRKAFASLKILLQDSLTWCFGFSNIESMYPAYRFLKSLTLLAKDFEGVLICFCEDLRIVWSWLSRIGQSHNLVCFWHQVTNIYVASYQGIMNFLIDVIRLIVLVIAGGGNFVVIVESFADGTFVIPSISKIYERVNAAATYLGEWLNDGVQISICTVIAEMESAGNVALVEQEFQTCMLREDTRIDFFCSLGPAVGAWTRYQKLTFRLILNFPRILREFFTLPPGPRFLTDVWVPDILWDTFRHPPSKLNHDVDVNFPPIVPNSNLSSIAIDNADLYGNFSLPIDFNCTIDPPIPRSYVPCGECPRVQDTTLEECACRLGPALDDLLEPFINKRLFEPALCCLFGTVVRTAVAIFKFITDFIVHVINIDRLPDFLVDQNNIEVVITEAIGRPDELGGVLGCLCKLINAIDPRLDCLCRLFVLTAKSLGELIRLVLTAVVRLFQDIFDRQTPRFFDYICLGNSANCLIPERSLKWLRIPREDPYPNFKFDRVEVLTNVTDLNKGAIDCFCDILNLKFVGQFFDIPELPDICCPFRAFFRTLISYYKNVFEFVLTFFETFGTFIDSDKPVSFIIVKWIACDNQNTCWPMAEWISDIEDFRNCPCTLMQGLDQLLNPGNPILLCFCEFFDALLLVPIAMRASATLLSAHVQLLDCIFTGFPVPKCTQVLGSRYASFWDHVFDYFDATGFNMRALGCFIGTIFSYDCIGVPHYRDPPDSPCIGGSILGVCTPAERFTVMFGDIFLVVNRQTVFGIRLMKAITALAFVIVLSPLDFSSIPTSIPDLLRDFLLSVAEPFIGDQSKVPPTAGLAQSAGLALSCILGPPSGGCNSEYHPSQGDCFGDYPWIFGTVIRRIYTALVEFWVAGIGVILTLFINPSNLADVFIAWVKAFFNLLAIIVGSLSVILDAMVGFIVAIVTFIFGDAIGELFNWVLGFLVNVVSIFVDAISFLLFFFGGGIGKKRSFEAADGLYRMVIDKDGNVMKRNILELISNTTSARNNVNSSRAKRNVEEEQEQEEEVNEFRKQFMEYYKNILPYIVLSVEDAERMYDGTKIVNNMTKGTFCHKVMNTLQDKTDFDHMSLPEEFLFKGCYMAYVLPILFNGHSNTTITLPRDFLYNVETFGVVVWEMVNGARAAFNWMSQVRTPTENVITTVKSTSNASNKKRNLQSHNYEHTGEPGFIVGMSNVTYEYEVLDNGTHTRMMFSDGFYGEVEEVTTFKQYMIDEGVKNNFVLDFFTQYNDDANARYGQTFNKLMGYLEYKREEMEFIMEEMAEIKSIEIESKREKRMLMLPQTEDILTISSGNSSAAAAIDDVGVKIIRDKLKSRYQRLDEYLRSEERMNRYEKIAKKERINRKNWKAGREFVPKTDKERATSAKELETSIENYNQALVKAIEERKARKIRAEKMRKTREIKRKKKEEKRRKRNVRKETKKKEKKERKAQAQEKQNRKRFTEDKEGEEEEEEEEEDDKPPDDGEYSKESFVMRWYSRYRDHIKYGYKRWNNKKRNNAASQSEEEEEEENYQYNPIHKKYGHILGNRTLFGHRWWAFKEVMYTIFSDHQNAMNVKLPEMVKNKHHDYVMDKHALAHEKGRRLAFHNIYATYEKIRTKAVILNNYMPKPSDAFRKLANPTVNEIKRHVEKRRLRDGEFLDYDYSVFEEGEMKKALKKRGLEAHIEPPIDICINRAEELTCSNCDQCQSWLSSTCLGCQSCIDCVDNGGGNVTCGKCSLCQSEGPGCTTCTGCSACETESVCANCQLAELLVVALDHVLFCKALANNDTSVIIRPHANVSFIEIVPLDANTTFTGDIIFTFVNDLLNTITGVNVFETIVGFIMNTNLDPAVGPIGLLFYIKQLPISFVGQCDRDINTMCTYGMGFKNGFLTSVGIFTGLGVFLWFFAPPISGIFTYLVSFFGVTATFMWLVGTLSWNYNIKCLGVPVSVLTFFFVPPYAVPPIFPQCAAREIFEFWDEIFAKCLFFFEYFALVGTDSCPNCPATVSFPDCREFGFTSWTRQITYPWQKYSLGTYTFVNNTCLVRGGCLIDLVLPSDIRGPLEPFFNVDFNFTSSEGTEQLDKCFFLTIPNLIGPIIFIILFYVFGSVFFTYIVQVLTWLFKGLTQVFPFNLLLPWNTQALFFGSESESQFSNMRPLPRRPRRRKKGGGGGGGGDTKSRIGLKYDTSSSSSSSDDDCDTRNVYRDKFANTTREAFLGTASSILVPQPQNPYLSELRRRRVQNKTN